MPSLWLGTVVVSFAERAGLAALIPEEGAKGQIIARPLRGPLFFVRVRLRKQARSATAHKKPRLKGEAMIWTCGEGGIRTRDTLSSIHTFQACSFNHSDTSPFKGGKNTISTLSRRIYFWHFLN